MSYINATRTKTHVWVNKRWRHVSNGSPSEIVRYFSISLPHTRSGEKVKDWKEKVKANQQAGSPYSLDATFLSKWEEGSMSYQATNVKSTPTENNVMYRERFTGNMSSPVSIPSHNATSLVKADSIALSKTYKKIQSELQSMNSPAVLAEFVDVLRQFGSPFRSIVDLTNRRLNRLELERRGLKGSTTFKKKKWASIVADTYLEYSFGLAPLISDTKNAAEALARLHAEKDGLLRPRRKIVSRGLDVANTIYTPTISRPPDCAYIWVKSEVSKTTECRVQYVCGLESTLRADLGSNDRLLQLLGFNHANWVPAIWEAVPWSFLIDYFTNVQQILEASVTNTSDVKWIVKTVTYRTEYDQFFPYDAVQNRLQNKADFRSGGAGGHAGRCNQVRLTLTRSLPATLGVPSLYFELPSSVKQLANMAALLVARKPSSSALWLF